MGECVFGGAGGMQSQRGGFGADIPKKAFPNNENIPILWTISKTSQHITRLKLLSLPELVDYTILQLMILQSLVGRGTARILAVYHATKDILNRFNRDRVMSDRWTTSP